MRSEIPRTTNEEKVWAILDLGADTAITIREIRRLIQIQPREIKAAVRGLRLRHNVAVCSSRGAKPGYFIAEKPEEITTCFEMLKADGIGCLRAAFSLPGRRNMRLRKMLGQLEMELKS